MNETEIFARVISHDDSGERNRILDQLCNGNDEMRARIEKLVKAHDDPNSFFDTLKRPGHFEDEAVSTSAPADTPPDQSGSMIGDYKLLQQIGEGGMGIVYMAEQVQPVKRRVALKIIKPGMDSRQVIARFEAERQALAMMDHPNIAKVLDAGTTELGHPYFVMELVNGMPITEYCDNEKMPTPERLKLFVSVCRAVQHAHQKGIIHRDLKPNNILVAEYDGQPSAKVIDFGVAKATGPTLTEKTLFTDFGQVIGTLEYMSPEQARRNQLDIDTRSDIYSLGIVLYSLLTGETPFDRDRFRKAAWEEMIKIITEEEPPRPSIKIGSSQSIDQVATQRSVEPRRLSSMVRGDLDWIVMKTLEKDRNRRYASANELAEDISRHLASKPLIARPPSTLDRLTKFGRRNRKVLVSVSFLLAIAVLAVAWQSNQVHRRQKEIRDRTNQVNQALKESSLAIAKAEASPLGYDAPWDAARAQIDRITDLLAQGMVEKETESQASTTVLEFQAKSQQRDIATQIEEVVIQGATYDDLTGWKNMEREMRVFFRKHGFDLDKTDPSEIGRKIRDDQFSVLWSDLLELWIGARGHVAHLSKTSLTASDMQPWADAIYLADDDPVRTGIRKFIYEGPPFLPEKLERVVKDVELKSLSPRTLAWLANCYIMAGEIEKSDEIHDAALEQYPHDLMVNHDVAYALYHQSRWQEAARAYHRCIGIRSNVPGIWKGLADVYENLGETEAANKANAEAAKLEHSETNH